MNRGHRRQAIFLDDECCAKFLEIAEQLYRRFRVKIHGYALMPNHYHLLVEVEGDGLARAMQYLQRQYSAWLNARRGHRGTLWEHRYLDRLVEDPRYWRHLLVYLHENPVRGHLALHPDDATYSSHRAYAGLARAPEWLTTDELLGAFGGRDAYREYVAASREHRIEPPPGFDPLNLFERFESQPQPIDRLMSIDEALAVFREVTGAEALRISPQVRPLLPLRWLAMEWLPRATGAPLAEIARQFGSPPQHFARTRRKLYAAIVKDPHLAALREELNASMLDSAGSTVVKRASG